MREGVCERGYEFVSVCERECATRNNPHVREQAGSHWRCAIVPTSERERERREREGGREQTHTSI